MDHRKQSKFITLITAAILFSGLLQGSMAWSADNTSLSQGINDYNNENYEEAIENLLKAVKQIPTSAEAAYYTGLTFKELIDYNSAKTYLEKAISLNPELKEAYVPLAEVLYGLGEKKKAEKHLKTAKSKGIKSADSSYLMGLILMEQGKPKEAAAEFKEATEREPRSEAGILSAEALNSMGVRESRLLLSAGYSFQYDDNVILKPSKESSIGAISDEDDTRHVFTAGGDYSISRGDLGLRAGYSFYQSLHQDLDYMDVQAHSLLIMPSYVINRGKIYLQGAYDYYLIDNEKYLKAITLKPSWSFSTEAGNGINLFAGIISKDFLQRPLSKEEERDGTNINAGIAVLFPFNADRSYVRADYTYDTEDTDGDNWDYSGHKGGLLLSQPLAPATDFTLSASYYLQSYKNRHSDPSFNKKREDKISAIEASLTYTYKGVDFNVHYSYTDSNSNMAVYDYSRNIAGIGANYTF